jgi:hypothetical protein
MTYCMTYRTTSYRMTSADRAALNMLLYRQIIPNVPIRGSRRRSVKPQSWPWEDVLAGAKTSATFLFFGRQTLPPNSVNLSRRVVRPALDPGIFTSAPGPKSTRLLCCQMSAFGASRHCDATTFMPVNDPQGDIAALRLLLCTLVSVIYADSSAPRAEELASAGP